MQRVAQVDEVGFVDEQQGFFAEHVHVALVEDVFKGVGQRVEFGRQALDELAVALHVLAFHNHDQFILLRELLAELQINIVITVFLADEVVAVHVHLEPAQSEGLECPCRVENAKNAEQDLRPDEPLRMTQEQPRNKTQRICESRRER